MPTVPETTFPEPEARRFAQAVFDDDLNAVRTALINSRGTVNAIGTDGETPLLLAVLRLNKAMVSTLLTAGADPNGAETRAPLAVAVLAFDSWFAETLLKAHASPNGKFGAEPAIWRAALGGRNEMTALLQRFGADIDATNEKGESPALIASKVDYYRTVMDLVKRGASCFSHDKIGRTLGYWAARSRLVPESDQGIARRQVVEWLESKGFPWPPPEPEVVLAFESQGLWPPRH
jgi:ankyrin repeat protein